MLDILVIFVFFFSFVATHNYLLNQSFINDPEQLKKTQSNSKRLSQSSITK